MPKTNHSFQSQTFIVGCSLLLGSLTFFACTKPSYQAEAEITTPSQENLVELGNADKLDRLSNQPIILSGTFQQQVDGALFLVKENGIQELGNVLILNQSERSFSVPLSENTQIMVFGQVKPLDFTGMDTIDSTTAKAYKGKLAVYAERVTLAPDPTELVEQAQAFYNQDVTIYGEIKVIDAPNTFILTDPNLFQGKGVIVIQTGSTAGQVVVDGTKASVSGILRPYVIADLKNDYGLTWDLSIQEKLDADYQQMPVLIADMITPVAN